MTKMQSDGTLEDLVTAVVRTDDPTLYERACHALSSLLAFSGDNHLQCE
jgi:hypothetical protein